MLALACFAACGGSVADGDKAPGDQSSGALCMSRREQFAREVWGKVLGQVCVQCHAPGGAAAEQNAKLKLLPATYPGFLDANFDNVVALAKLSYDGKPVILQKPIGGLNHGGGAALKEDGPQYAILKSFIGSLDQPDPCAMSSAGQTTEGLVLLDAQETYRKATLQLGDRLPTADEVDRIDREGEAALAPLLDQLMKEHAFVDRVMELYNDRLLTDFYMRYTGAGVALLSQDDYAGAGSAFDALDDAHKQRANLGIAREPLLIIAHVVDNDLPFSEILTANYTVVNADSAGVYGLKLSFDDPTNAMALQTAQVTATRGGKPVAIPHAGVLTTPAFLNRFPTTPTNRNRHRARKVYDFFLATDILKAADRPIDPLAATNFNNPTRDDPQCKVCHLQIDPIAGAFMKWNDRDPERYDVDKEWFADMVAPGFAGEVMQTADFGRAQQWLAERVVKDPRFVLSTVRTVFRGITGQEPLEYPLDSSAADYSASLNAWLAQDAQFRAVGQKFIDENMRFKTVVRELVLSPYFRAKNTTADLAAGEHAALAALGTARLASPERLAAKIEAAAGVPWSRSAGSGALLLRDYRLLYGGIDSDSITVRLTQPNGIIAGVATRMANEVACAATAYDFSRKSEERALFPGVEIGDVPETAIGAAVPESVARIRTAIARLHGRVLGEELAPDSAEVDATYGVFLDTFHELSKSATAMDRNQALNYACQARVDPKTGKDLPEAQRISRDDNYTIRSWMAVMTYLLSDYRFLYEP